MPFFTKPKEGEENRKEKNFLKPRGKKKKKTKNANYSIKKVPAGSKKTTLSGLFFIREENS